jgi:hypothetical protein
MNILKLRLLFHRQWIESRKAFAFFALATAAALGLLFLITWHWRDSFSGAVNNGIFLIGLFVTGALFGNTIFKELGSDPKNAWQLSLPASPLEKLLTALFFGLVIYFASYIAIFYIVEGFHLWLINRNGIEMPHINFFKNGFYGFIFPFIKFQLIILLGSLYFKKLALLKTILFLIILFFVSNNGNLLLLKQITGEETITSAIPFSYFQFTHAGENVYVNLPASAALTTSILLDYCLPLFLVYLAYIKFRETEI